MSVTKEQDQLLESLYISAKSQSLPKIPRCPVSGVFGFGLVKVLSVYSLYVTFQYLPPILPWLLPKKTSEALQKGLWESKDECLPDRVAFPWRVNEETKTDGLTLSRTITAKGHSNFPQGLFQTRNCPQEWVKTEWPDIFHKQKTKRKHQIWQ